MREKPSFILLDVVMPVLDGRDALRILKNNPRTADIPIIMLTSLDDDEEETFATQAGAAALLNKPIPENVLQVLVQKYTT